jgi:hypothetical protein
MFYAGSNCFRATCFEEPTPPAWREDDISAILNAAGGRLDGSAGDVYFLLQSQWKWEKSVQAELVSFGIDLFDLEDEVPPGAAKGFSCEGDGLADGGWTFWLTTFYRDIGPLGPAFPLDEVLPDHLDRRRDDGGGTNCQTHSMFLLSIAGWGQGTVYASPPSWSHTDFREMPSLDQEGSLASSGSCVFLLTGPQDAISVRLLQNSLQAVKSLIGPVAVDQMEDGIDQPPGATDTHMHTSLSGFSLLSWPCMSEGDTTSNVAVISGILSHL